MNFQINDQVISTQFGIGKVVSKDSQGDFEFYSVQTHVNNTKVMVPLKSKNKMRKVARPSEIQDLMEMTTFRPLPEFKNKKERVLYFKEGLSNQNLENRVSMIAQLSQLDDIGKVEKNMLLNFREILETELCYVLELDSKKAQYRIDQFIKKLNA